MSVIFETLQKLKHDTGEEEGRIPKTGKRGNAYTFRGIFLSFPGLLGLALLLVTAGLGVKYGIGYFTSDPIKNAVQPAFSEEKRPSLEKAGTNSRTATQGVQSPSEKEDRSQDIPPPPAHIPVEEVEPGKLYLPSARKVNPVQAESDTEARYIPPESQAGTVRLAISKQNPPVTDLDPSDNGEPARVGEKAKGPSPYFKKARGQREFFVKSGDLSDNRPSTGGSSGPGDKDQGELVSDSIDNRGDKAAGEVSAEAERLKKIRAANFEKSAGIARLVAEIQRTMLSKDSIRVETLFDELSLLKGDEDDYVIRLKAFWMLKQGDCESAGLLLESLLQKNANDLEAGINMAVVEIKTNRLDQARTRLERLRHSHAGNRQIASLLKKIGR